MFICIDEMEKATAIAYFRQIENTSAARLHSAKVKKRPNFSYSLFAYIIISFIIFAQMPESSTAAALFQSPESNSESLESIEDMWDLLHELTDLSSGENDSNTWVQKLRKRHNGGADERDKPEWQNICGFDSEWSGDEIPDQLKDDYVQLYMKNLRKSANIEYKALKSNGLHDIDIDDMRAWRRHERKYKFLPTLDLNSPISLACWHQDMQTFIASFAYLYEIQQQLDHQHLHTQSRIAHELNALLQSSRRMLCEIETSIRGSYPPDKRHQLYVLTREEMLAKINFYTTDSAHGIAGKLSVNHTDLRFVKFFYKNFLQRMLRILPRHPKNIQLEYACVRREHQTILDTSMEADAEATNVVSGEVDDDGSRE